MAPRNPTLSTATIRQFYDWLGEWHDRVEFFEGRAKKSAHERLQLRPGLRLLNAGCGTGKDQQKLAASVQPDGLAIGVDISAVMAGLTARRAECPTCQADVRRLPFADRSFDRLLCSYVLDVMPAGDLASIMREFRRLLRPEGFMVLISLSHGQQPLPRVVTAFWMLGYRLSPLLLGGCRPVDLIGPLETLGLRIRAHETIAQLGVSSQVIVAGR